MVCEKSQDELGCVVLMEFGNEHDTKRQTDLAHRRLVTGRNAEVADFRYLIADMSRGRHWLVADVTGKSA